MAIYLNSQILLLLLLQNESILMKQISKSIRAKCLSPIHIQKIAYTKLLKNC